MFKQKRRKKANLYRNSFKNRMNYDSFPAIVSVLTNNITSAGRLLVTTRSLGIGLTVEAIPSPSSAVAGVFTNNSDYGKQEEHQQP
jgi:hypothetical protein